MEQQPDNSDGFAQWFTENNADGQYDEKTGQYTSGKYRGKTRNEAMMLARDEFGALNQSTPGFADKWGSRARGEDVSTGPRAMGQLPENMRGMPNTPDLSGFQQFDKQGRQVAGPSPTARQRFMDSVGQVAAKKTAATNAVNQRKIEQINNPAMVADMSIAAKDAQLAQSGITDLGGGTKAMKNKYGTGFATQMTPEEFAKRKPGVIIDEKGVVDTAGMMANKGTGTTTPYADTVNTAGALDMRDQNRADIQAKTLAAIPGAEARRAADRMTTIAAVKQQQAPLAATPGFSPTVAGPFNSTPQIPPPAGVVAQTQPQAPKTAVPAPTITGTNVPNVTALPMSGGLPDDRPGVASAAARGQAFQGVSKPQPTPATQSVGAMKGAMDFVKQIPANITRNVRQTYDETKRQIFGS